MIILVKMWTIFIFKQYNLTEVSIVKKKIGLTVLYFLGLIALYGFLAWTVNRIKFFNFIFEDCGIVIKDRVIDYIMPVIGVLLVMGVTAILIVNIIKIWKLSPKELKERVENRLIEVEMEQRKEKELALLEIEKKKKEIEELEKKLN